MGRTFALIHLGNDDSYGLCFVAGELLRQKQAIVWIDGDEPDIVERILALAPDFVALSPLSSNYAHSLEIAREVKKHNANILTVFGGHQVFALPDTIDQDGVDIVVKGPVYGTVQKILKAAPKTVLVGTPVSPARMSPERTLYFQSIPRMANRHRKYVMSQFGCVYNCSYCSTSALRKFYGPKVYNKYWLSRRPIRQLIEEAKVLLEFNTREVSFEDDDALAGPNPEVWLKKFSAAWKKEIGIPLYANVTPNTVVKVSDEALRALAGMVTSVQMGVQAARPESLKLFNRAFQSEAQVKAAYERLMSFGIKTKLEVIVGLPVADPLEDALETVKMCQRVAPGTFIACFPLMLYPGTRLYRHCADKGIALADECKFEWHTGVGSIQFDQETSRQIKNLTKMATMFVRYGVDERWMRALIKMELTETASRELSECQYLESLLFRIGESVRGEFEDILKSMHFQY
ncbi:MAG: hypothetical protein A2051_10185 [Desulfovibrionales bacterium GWA2_65_9]|nr:MAG: hypothetical protein A2051_10185 [Desulfovibrionales bacterium GWA2_65_9]